MAKFCLLLVMVLVAGVSSQSYPRFELGRNNILNNSILFHGSIGKGQDDSLRCVTDNSECCTNGEGNWYDERGDEVHEGSDGDSDLYVTRGQGVVYLNRRGWGSVGLWRCDVPDSNGVQQSLYTYLGTAGTGIHLHSLVSCCPLLHKTGALFNPPNLYFTLDSEVSEDPPQFTLTCVSKGGPATRVVWRRDGKEITENSTYSTSQIIVNASSIPVYNNTLKVRGREGGVYKCTVSNSQSLSSIIAAQLTLSCKWLYPRYFYGSLFMLKSDSPTPSNLTATYKSPSTVLLEWMFSDPVVCDTMYTVYYQSGGVSYNKSFTLTEDQRLYLMMDLPLEVITNVFIVAKIAVISGVFCLPSPVVGPASLGMLLHIATTLATWYHYHSHSGISGGGGVRRRTRSGRDFIHTDMYCQSTQWSGARLYSYPVAGTINTTD